MKKMIGRRNFLRLAAVSPVATKVAAEKIATQLTGVSVLGQTPANYYGYGDPKPTPSSGEIGHLQWRTILQNAANRREIESIYYEEERRVGFIDPDLAVLRSLSLNAKIAFQRQRNVERRIQSLQTEWSWKRTEAITKRFIGI